MTLYYSNQTSFPVFENVTLTAAYTGNRKTIDVKGMSKLTLDINYARGAAEASSKLQFTIESSTDGTNWHALTIDTTGATSVITNRVWELEATGKVSILVDIAYEKLRISAQEAGVSANAGTLTMTALVSGQ